MFINVIGQHTFITFEFNFTAYINIVIIIFSCSIVKYQLNFELKVIIFDST